MDHWDGHKFRTRKCVPEDALGPVKKNLTPRPSLCRVTRRRSFMNFCKPSLLSVDFYQLGGFFV